MTRKTDVAKAMREARQLAGKIVKCVKLRPFSDGRDGTAYNPHIIFTDGTTLAFDVMETESLEYGLVLIVERSDG